MTEVALDPTPTDLNLSFIQDGETIDDADILTPFNDAIEEIDQARQQVAAANGDTHVGNLNDKLLVLAPIIKTILDSSGNKKLQLSLSDELTLFEVFLTALGRVPASGIDATGATSGYALVADGAGNVGWAAQAGGGAQPVDITVTAGETLAERDIVFIDPSDDLAYKLDIDALPIKVSKVIGIVNHSGGISAAATGTIRLIGEVSGFSGLTPYADVWADSTAGGYTQTKPTLSAGGGQKALIRIGYAVSATAIMVMPPGIEFHKREALVNNGEMTITHIMDAQGYTRKASALIASTLAGPSVASYSDSNRDDRAQLRGVNGAGGTTTPASSTDTYYEIGDSSGTPYWQAQSFLVNTGKLSQITFTLRASGGTPTGTMTWEIRADNSGNPTGALLATSTISPTASATNTINLSDGPVLFSSTTYWLVLKPTATQTGSNQWRLDALTTNPYASGLLKQATDNTGSSWSSAGGGIVDARCSITTTALTVRDKLSQSFQLAGAETIQQATLQLRKVGTPTGTLTLRIETDNSGNPSGTLAHANATTTLSETTLTENYGLITFSFASTFALSGATSYWLVLSTDRSASNANYVEWGADFSAPAYASGQMKAESASSWNVLSADAIFNVISLGTTFFGQADVDFWTFTEDANLVVRFDDGAGADETTKSTFKNTSGSTLDVTAIVRI